MKYPLLVILILTTATVIFGADLECIYSWKFVDFCWKSAAQKEEAIRSGNYDPKKCVLYDVDMSPDGRVFVTAVRDKGVPASLMTVSNKVGPGGPLLEPYPNWSWYDENDKCNGIISVYRVSIKCNYLFVLDCGKIGEDAVCPPKLLIFNLETDMLVNSITIPPNIASNANGTGLLVTPLAYVRDCDINYVTVFMADVEGYGLVIYKGDIRRCRKSDSQFCRIESDFMKPTNPNFTIENQSFDLKDGLLGLTIIDNKLFIAPLAATEIYKMEMCNKDYSKCSNITESEADEMTQLAGTLSGQTAPIASEQCAIFFSNIPETSILCQDATKEFNSTNTELIAQNSEKLQFASGMKVINHGYITFLMVLTNRYQRVATNTLELNETNFRICNIDMKQIRKDTNCFASCNDNKHHGYRYGEKPWYGKPWNRKPWCDKPWYGKSWYGKSWYGKSWYSKPWEDKHDNNDKYDNKYDKYNKDNNHDKNDQDDKHDK